MSASRHLQEIQESGVAEEPQWFETKQDNFDPTNKQTFKLRYWDNKTNWDKQNGPLILYICGEWTCAPQAEGSFTDILAKKFNARLFTLEHRYYGASQPFDDWQTENLRFLTADQGLKDMVRFADSKAQEIAEKEKIPKRRWLIIGGSYPGAMSAWARYKYPHVFFASLASSGVVNAVKDFWQFDDQIYQALMKSGSECPAIVAEITKYIEDEFTAGRGQPIKEIFEATDVPDDEFFWFFADITVETVQYGNRQLLCDKLKELKGKNTEILKQYAKWAPENRASLDMYAAKFLRDTTYDIDKNGRQWTYQYCSELAYFQTPPQQNSMRSNMLNLDFWKSYCQRIFDKDLDPDTTHYNWLYGETHPQASRIIFTNGSEDPWKRASILTSKNKRVLPIEIVCDGCAHCVDLHKPSDDDAQTLKDARVKIERQLDHWIKVEMGNSSTVSIYERERIMDQLDDQREELKEILA